MDWMDKEDGPRKKGSVSRCLGTILIPYLV